MYLYVRLSQYRAMSFNLLAAGARHFACVVFFSLEIFSFILNAVALIKLEIIITTKTRVREMNTLR